MGMFDTIHCELELPGEPMVREFQTKSLSCDLNVYTLTAAGRLRLDSTIFGPEEGGTELELTGEVRFYSDEPETGRWREYVALFREGTCIHVEERERRR